MKESAETDDMWRVRGFFLQKITKDYGCYYYPPRLDRENMCVLIVALYYFQDFESRQVHDARATRYHENPEKSLCSSTTTIDVAH